MRWTLGREGILRLLRLWLRLLWLLLRMLHGWAANGARMRFFQLALYRLDLVI